MMDAQTLLAFAAASFVLAATPGPDMMLCASRAATQGRAAGMAALAGIVTGLQLHAIAAGLGLSQLILATPAAFEAIRWAGAAYLVYLAVKALRAPRAAAGGAPNATGGSLLEAYRMGLLTNLLNPKVILFVLALYPQFISLEGSIFWQMTLLGAINNLVATPVTAAVALFAARVSGGLSKGSGKLAAAGRWLMATMFAGLAARLAIGAQS
jgi:threonine/homoserine/homoserine lactone efflux protein